MIRLDRYKPQFFESGVLTTSLPMRAASNELRPPLHWALPHEGQGNFKRKSSMALIARGEGKKLVAIDMWN